jgi:Head binding.
MADENEVRLPYDYYPDPTRGRPVFNGSIYVGRPDTDPQIATNRLQVTAIQEDGISVPIAQPIRTGAGGVPMLNGSPIQLQVSGEYSIKVLDHLGAQVYYAASLVSGVTPTTIIRTQLVPLSLSLSDRFINAYLFNSNISWADYYAANKPAMNLGLIGSAPFEIENIPTFRFDLAQNTSTTDLGVLT